MSLEVYHPLQFSGRAEVFFENSPDAIINVEPKFKTTTLVKLKKKRSLVQK